MNARVAIPGLGVETVTTRDIVIAEADGTVTSRPCAPPGDGWRIADSSRERHTTWRRVRIVDMRSRPVPHAPRLSSPPWRD